MNQTVLNITDFQPIDANSMQIIDVKDFNIKKLFRQSMQLHEDQNYYIIVKKPFNLLKKITKKLFLIKAAGGLVQNEAGNYLFIHRLGKWDLPKGKLDPREKTKSAAIREVEEECGVQVYPDVQKLTKTYHLYHYKGKLAIKRTTWYAMRVAGNPDLTPQLEEDITEARWFSPGENLMPVLENTYKMVAGLIYEFIPENRL